MAKAEYSKFDLKKKIIISIIGFFMALSIIVGLIVIPTIREIKRMGADIEEQRLDLEKKYIKGQSLKQLADNLKKISPQLDKLDRIFINHNRELEFITTLEDKTQANKIAQKISLGAAKDDNQKFKIIPMQIYTQGSFINQYNYLVNLELLDYYISIKALELSPAQGQTIYNTGEIEPNSVNMFITADTFWK